MLSKFFKRSFSLNSQKSTRAGVGKRLGLSYGQLEEKKLLAIDFTGGGLPSDQTAQAYLFVGDHSRSNSEIYSLTVDGAVIQPSSHGDVERERGLFERGNSYNVSADWVSTNRENEDGESEPDHDYRVWVDRLSRPRWTSGSPSPSSQDFFVTDQSGLFQRRFFSDPGGTDPTSGKTAAIHFPAIDLDIDSDNSGLVNRSLSEDIAETDRKAGVEFSVLSGDRDEDGIADNYDFDGVSGARFEEVVVSLSENWQYLSGTPSLEFDFDDAGYSDASTGLFRLWTKDAGSFRTESDLIPAGESLSAVSLGIMPGQSKTFYLEAVNPTRRTVNFDPISVSASSSSSVWSGTVSDTVHAVGKRVAIDISVNGDDDLLDAVDGVDKFLPGYEGDQPVLTSTNAQSVKIVVSGLTPNSVVSLELEGTTKHKGFSSNLGADSGFDYRFSNGNQQIANLTADVNGDLAVPLTVHDFGGETTIVVQDAEGDELVSLLVPLDGDGDKLPDVFEDRFDGFDKTKESTVAGVVDGESDQDILNAGETEFAKRGLHAGDKLSAFDEYRGFIVGDEHTRTSPEVKDVFVFDGLGDIVLPDGGNVGEERFDLFPQIGVELHVIDNILEFDSVENAISRNSVVGSEGDVIRVRKSTDLPDLVNGQTNGRDVQINIDALTSEIDIVSVGTVQNTSVLVYRPTSNAKFADNGQVQIGGQAYSYQQNVPQLVFRAGGAVIQQEEETVGVTLPANSQTVILEGNSGEKFLFLLNERTGEVFDINLTRGGIAVAPKGGGSSSLSNAISATDTTLVLPADAVTQNSDPEGGLLYLKIGNEYISYTGHTVAGNQVTLSGVQRGQLNTVEVAHNQGASVTIPSQFTNITRGALDTDPDELRVGDKLVPVAFLVGVKLASDNVTAPPADSDKFGVYSDPKKFLQVTIAHELGHAIIDLGGDAEHGVAPADLGIQRSIMGSATVLGRFEGGNGEAELFTHFDDATRKQIDLTYEG